ncbi:MAG: DM13 domain-containing protein [Leptolyngbyaceae cyanobacterium RU_5_1]|nr:DM13 domain-containing protein [Leptolyngbyaceae cyanobacterium RU_5_1]
MKRLMFASLSVLLISGVASVLNPELATARTTTGTLMSQQKVAVLKSGSFRAGEHPTTGGARIVEIGGKRFVELDGNFKTDAGPDLFVILHRSRNVIGSTKPPAYSINEGDYVSLAPLRKTNGTQRYAIPANVKLDNYGSVAIWCRKFNATFGAAALGN